MKSLLIISQGTPYGRGTAAEALDTAMAAAALDVPVTLLFDGDGVYQLLPAQAGGELGVRNLSQGLEALPAFEVERCFVAGPALAQRSLSPETLALPGPLLDAEALAALLRSADVVLTY
ncbi:MAG: sulfurtransferase complex subunit TusC [Pseudomonadota bacterium]|nr:sulfurtransferase complex subunit TusC [Pseudomonadota bacterium]MEC8718246.1 sulfurtransferase complex subunit TusC [Pseudomonadota bacterium]MED5442663.1 sulfurtransferase complex subunit TusC [Pseudomonadota bacterium]